MWIDREVKCPTCRMGGPFKMFSKALIDLKRPPPLDNQVMITCPFGIHRFALRRIREYFTDPEWEQIVGMVESEKTKWLE